MARLRQLVLLVSCIQLAALSEPGCEIELECEECLPEHMPSVEGPESGLGGVLRIAAGGGLRLSCGMGAFLAYPTRRDISAVCEGGQWRLRHDNTLHPLLDFGCQESIFEDVLHPVEHCGGGLQGRAYLTRAEGGAARHLATLCFDPDRAVAVRAHTAAALSLPAHAEPGGPLSLLGNFNHMFDARTRHEGERLYGDEAALARRLRALVRHEGASLAGQGLTAARLLPAGYFAPKDARAADFPSNKIAAWRSVAEGNLRHLQRDVSAALGRAAGLRVWAGASGAATLRGGRELWLKAGRFPVPRYVWTLVMDARRRRALAVVVLNDPFVSVSEVRERVWCESACGQTRWLAELLAARRYETPLYGLTFCCAAHEAAAELAGLPAALLDAVPRGKEGMLLDLGD